MMAELTALENVMVPLLLQKKDRAEAERASRHWLERVGLSHRATEGAAKGLGFALATGLTIGCYTLIDASGVLVREWRKVKVNGHVENVLQAARSL